VLVALAVLPAVANAAPVRSCTETLRRFEAPRDGYLTARLSGHAHGDWDLAVFRRGRGRPVAASAYRGRREVASGFVRQGDRLVVRACGGTGRGTGLRASIAVEPLRGGPLRDRDDAGVNRRPAHRAPSVRGAALSSGPRSEYRRLADYSAEMKQLAAENPGLVKPFTLPHPTWQGRPVEGIEITTDVGARDGKPVFLLLGLHHANEWPSGEHALEWAYELVDGYKAGDPRTRPLVESTRTIVVPVVNPDGFNFSREGVGTPAENQRKNCRGGTCVAGQGVDVNRNYGDLWGGTGASPDPNSGNYRGPQPFSEPEAQNVRELISTRQVVTMITNHTSGRVILRQPGLRSQPPTPDETLYRSLGDAMAAQNGYVNEFSWQLYDHVGTADGWSYYTTGGLGYVFEIMSGASHPAYGGVVGEFDGNRRAYYVAQESTANAERHAILTGSAPPGTILRLTKDFANRTSVSGLTTEEHFDTTVEVPASGQFEWHVNQSGRPLAPDERWALTCERPEGNVLSTTEVAIARGESLAPDLGACIPPPGPAAVTISAKLTANVSRRFYRARVRGRLPDVDPGPRAERCAGKVAIALRARGKTVARGNPFVDSHCAYDRSFRFKRRKLGRKRVGRLTATVRWSGNDFLQAAEATISAGVKAPRR
jgi:hypothetical protein